MLAISLIIISISSYLGLFLLYYFQIKEYRPDRIRSYLNEKGLFWMLFKNKYMFPAISTRNFLILFLYMFMVIWYLVLFPVIFLPLVSLLFMYGAVLITSPFANVRRNNIVSKARSKLKNKKLIIIAITGSFGKTSVKEHLYQILSSKFNVAKTEKNQNTDVGVALGILKNVTESTEIFIAEIGAYKQKEIAKVVSWLDPKYAILTGIGNQHLDLFGSQENLIKAKLEIAGNAVETLYYNADTITEDTINKYVAVKNLIGYSSNDLPIPFKNDLPGIHSQLNLLPCILFARDLGMTDTEIGVAINNISPIQGKLSTHIGVNNLKFVDDSYNSSVDGFLAGIDYLASNFQSVSKYIISKGIIELGADKLASYKRIISKLNEHNITLITTDKDFCVETCADELSMYKQILAIPSDSVILLEGRFSKRFMERLTLK